MLYTPGTFRCTQEDVSMIVEPWKLNCTEEQLIYVSLISTYRYRYTKKKNLTSEVDL